MNRENIIINSIQNSYEETTWIGQDTKYKLVSILVDFKKLGNYFFKGEVKISTNKPLSEEEIKDKIIEVLK